MKNYNGIINISEPDDDYSIYIMYSSDENDNSIYVGVTKNPKQRVYKHSMERKRGMNINKPLYIWLNDLLDKEERSVIFEVIEEKCVNCHSCISVCPIKYCIDGSGEKVEPAFRAGRSLRARHAIIKKGHEK